MSEAPYKINAQYDTEPVKAVELAEIRLDDALRTIKNLDHKMAELKETRDTYMKQLAEALRELQEKCGAADSMIADTYSVQAPSGPDIFG